MSADGGIPEGSAAPGAPAGRAEAAARDVLRRAGAGDVLRRVGAGDLLRRVGAGARGALDLLFPPVCLCCGERVAAQGGLCGACWREAEFLRGPGCDACAVPLPEVEEDGVEEDGAAPLLCDACAAAPPPWARARAVFRYGGTARSLVLGLKNDRLDLAPPLARWLLAAAAPLLEEDMLVAPVPLHRTRLLARRYNQCALLSAPLARAAGLAHIPDLLERARRTPKQEGLDSAARAANLAGAIRPARRHLPALAGRHVLLVDDVLTTGSTLRAAAAACRAGGAAEVSVVVLARVARDA